MPDELVVIARFEMALEAHEAKAVLGDAGIESAVADETAVHLGIPGSIGLGGVKLLVREGDVGMAVGVLRDTPAANDLVVELDEEPSGGPEENL